MDESTQLLDTSTLSVDTLAENDMPLDGQLDTLALETQKRESRRISCNDLEMANFKRVLADPVINAYFNYWCNDECRLLAVPPWFRHAYDDGEREKFIAPRDRGRYGLSELTKAQYTKAVIDSKYS
jgi:hypothetical protein